MRTIQSTHVRAMSDDPDSEYYPIADSTIIRAHQHAAGAKRLKIRPLAVRTEDPGTKIHMAVRGLDCPVRFTLTAGQKGDDRKLMP
ncbi:hypothetical protein ATY79_23980 [Rhizobium sp. R693]|nr:hypothetical protein ATY79_23980 [Rhizobium sp. R693]